MKSFRTAALKKVDDLLGKMVADETALDLGWASFGVALANVQKDQTWSGEFESFNEFLLALKERHGIGRVQLYAYAGVVRVLTDKGISPKEIQKMGITKASLFKKAIEQSGRAPSDAILQAALDPETTVKDIRKMLVEERFLGIEPEVEGMSLLDLSFYVTADQKNVIERALKAAAAVDPVIQTEDLMDDPKAIREAVYRMAMDFVGTWEKEEK